MSTLPPSTRERSLEAMNSSRFSSRPFEVVIAGGGVAALETALALRELAGDIVAVALLAPDPTFVYRPARVKEPFGYAAAETYPLDELVAETYPLDELVADIGVELVQDTFSSLDAAASLVTTGTGRGLRSGGHGSSSEISEEPRSSPPLKIAAKYLAPSLLSRDRQTL